MKDTKKKVVAIVPVYNEEDFIVDTINNIKKIELIDEIIVVDDGSVDNTQEILKRLNVNFIRLEKNRGKGYAIKTAIKKIEFDYLVLIDGDLGKSSEEAKKLIIPAIQNEADVIIAKFKKAKKKGGFGLVKRLANKGVFHFTKENINSVLSGQRVYSKKVIDSIDFIPNRFGIEVAMTIEALKKGFRIKEVEVGMTHRETERNLKGFIHRGKQFFNILLTLIILKFRR